MSATQGSNITQEAIGHFTEALRQRIGDDRFRLWFTHGVEFAVSENPPSIVIQCSSPFAAQRMGKNFPSQLRAAAMSAIGDAASYRIDVAPSPVQTGLFDQAETVQYDVSDEPINSVERPHPTKTIRKPQNNRRRGNVTSLSDALNQSSAKGSPKSVTPTSTGRTKGTTPRAEPNVRTKPVAKRSEPAPSDDSVLPESAPIGGRTLDSFLTGTCNDFAYSAAMMAIGSPQIATPLFIHGPSGSGKSHLLAGLADAFRSRRRMRRVVLLTAEQFTNDFITSVGNTGLPGFRRRYRDVDALLIDDVHFLATKSATLREALYTVETLTAAGKPLVFTANLPPSEIRGLTSEVSGRMTSGLVCPLLEIDEATRLAILRRAVSQRCVLDCDETLLMEVATMLPGDARAIAGVANLIGMLQRMFRREPTIEEVRRYAGDLLRCQKVAPTLRSIERAVCDTFGLESDGLRSKAQTRRVSEPRTLAMYLARIHTGSAFTEIAQHFGRRSHSGVIAAQAKVETWLNANKQIGSGSSALTLHDAIAKIESRLRTG